MASLPTSLSSLLTRSPPHIHTHTETLDGFTVIDRSITPQPINIEQQLEDFKQTLVETVAIQLNSRKADAQDQHDNLIQLMGLLMEDMRRVNDQQQDILSKLDNVEQQLIEQADREKNMRIRSYFMGGPAYAFMNNKAGTSFVS